MRRVSNPLVRPGDSQEPRPEGGGISLFDQLNGDQRSLVGAVRQEFQEKLGVEVEHQRLVIAEGISGLEAFIIDSSPNGLHIGKFSRIVQRRSQNPLWFTIELAGGYIDPLAYTTQAVYRAMIADAQERGETVMPDSIELSHQNDIPWTATFLTGEPLTPEGQVLIASFSSDKVDVVGFNPDRGGVSMRVRPCVPLGPIEGWE